MTGRVFEFPSGKEQSGPFLRRWSVISALVRQFGVKQEPVDGLDGVVSQVPVFSVELRSFGSEDKVLTWFAAIGVENLHHMLSLIIAAAHARGDSISITDYTKGVAELPEQYAVENQT